MADQPTRPASEEELFDQSVELAREAGLLPADKGAETPEKPDAKPPAETRPAAGDGDGGRAARDTQGRFAPKPPPFEGFDKLDPAARQYIEKLQSEHKREQNQARTAQRELSRLRQPPPQPRTPPAPGPGKAPPPAVAATARVLPKWDAAAKNPEHAEFFGTLEERIAAGEAELGRKLTDIEAKQAAIDQRLQRADAIATRFEQREAAEHRTTSRNVLDDMSPGWRRTAGWVDAAGNAVDADSQQFVPEFEAWLAAHPPSVQQRIIQDLDSTDPHVSGSVFQSFDRDYALALLSNGQQAAPGETTARAAPTPRPTPRQAAIADVQPRPGAGGRVPREPEPQTLPRLQAEEAAFAAATTTENMRVWRGQR